MAKRMGVLREFMLFLKTNKAYWLAPIIIALSLIAAFLVLGGFVPAVYTLF